MIRINDLSFSYGSTEVLSNINLSFESGRIYGLLGENGVGKTTLLTLLCGLKRPARGRIVIDGYTPFDRKPGFLSSQFYLPDEVAPVNMKASEYAKRIGEFWPNYSHDVFCEIMSEFETDVDKHLNKMSAGQLKKSYISLSIATGARYLFMDEPTNGLDIPSKTSFRKVIAKYLYSEDSTVIISTHQVRDLENIIDPVVILENNEVLLNASIEEISRTLFFDYGYTLHPDALYVEQLPGGYLQVILNPDGADSKVNIEALFNAARTHKDVFKSLFNKGK